MYKRKQKIVGPVLLPLSQKQNSDYLPVGAELGCKCEILATQKSVIKQISPLLISKVLFLSLWNEMALRKTIASLLDFHSASVWCHLQDALLQDTLKQK